MVHDPRVIEERAALISDKALTSAMLVATEPEHVIKRAEDFIKVGVNHVVAVDGSLDGDYPTMALSALIPALMAEHYERAFVIGWGTGVKTTGTTSSRRNVSLN